MMNIYEVEEGKMKIRAVKQFIGGLINKYRQWRLDRALRPFMDGGLVGHARNEIGHKFKESGPDRWMAAHMIRMMALFASEGHSGFSAQIARQWFWRLSGFEPLGPLQGSDDEWVAHDEDGEVRIYQNRRCSRVFKQPNGIAYDIEGRVYEEPGGARFTSSGSAVPVTFPYVPERRIVKLNALGEPEDPDEIGPHESELKTA